jgi:hypothetical protein
MTSDKVSQAVTELLEFMNEADKTAGTAHSGAWYELAGGRKYLRIAKHYIGSVDGGSVHCFVDAQTGSVYKPATWNAPALNGERYNLLDQKSVETLHSRWDPYGYYLYKG